MWTGLVVECVLSVSERDGLVSKLHTPGSRCELVCQDVPAGVAYARIRIEPDQTHYNTPGRRGAPPGAMHPVTERILRAINDAIAELAAAERSRADADHRDGA